MLNKKSMTRSQSARNATNKRFN